MLTGRGNTLFYKMIITLFGVLKTQRLIHGVWWICKTERSVEKM